MSVYDQVGGLRPGKSAFDLSYSNMFDADIGQLVPVWIQDAGPGDIMQIGASQITKMQPMVVPLYHRMNMCYHVFSCHIAYFGRIGRSLSLVVLPEMRLLGFRVLWLTRISLCEFVGMASGIMQVFD